MSLGITMCHQASSPLTQVVVAQVQVSQPRQVPRLPLGAIAAGRHLIRSIICTLTGGHRWVTCSACSACSLLCCILCWVRAVLLSSARLPEFPCTSKRCLTLDITQVLAQRVTG